MRLSRTILGFTVAATLTISPAYAGSQGPTATTHGNKPITTGKPTTTHGDHSITTSKPTKPGSTPTRSATPPPTHLNPIAAKISSHPQLKAKITAMLPPGMTLNQASAGFKNQGQFIAALHVSQNLGISFTSLKNDMTKKHMSLGQAIQDVKGASTTTATSDAARGKREADDDVKKIATATSPSTDKSSKRTTRAGDDE